MHMGRTSYTCKNILVILSEWWGFFYIQFSWSLHFQERILLGATSLTMPICYNKRQPPFILLLLFIMFFFFFFKHAHLPYCATSWSQACTTTIQPLHNCSNELLKHWTKKQTQTTIAILLKNTTSDLWTLWDTAWFSSPTVPVLEKPKN